MQLADDVRRLGLTLVALAVVAFECKERTSAQFCAWQPLVSDGGLALIEIEPTKRRIYGRDWIAFEFNQRRRGFSSSWPPGKQTPARTHNIATYIYIYIVVYSMWLEP